MPFVVIPADSLAPGEAPPFDIFDHRGRLLCKAWSTPSADHRWQIWASQNLYTTTSQLEDYKRRLYQEANKIIDDPKTTLAALKQLHVKRPERASMDGGYKTPGRRYVENLLDLHWALQQGLAADRQAWGEGDVEALMAMSVEIYTMLAEHPEIAMIVARREIQLSVSPPETAAGVYLYLLASAAWIGSLSSCPDDVRQTLVPYSIVARLMVKSVLHPQRSQRHDMVPEILRLGGWLFDNAGAHLPDDAPHAQAEADSLFSLLTPAFSLLRLQGGRLKGLREPWAFFEHPWEPPAYRNPIKALASALESSAGIFWPGDFVELDGGDIGLVGDADAHPLPPLVLRIISSDGMYLPRPVSSKPGVASHRIRRRLDSGMPKVAFDASLVADVVFSSLGNWRANAA